MFSANSSQVSEDKLFVEDVFSTWLYTGNSSTQTITNGIDLAGKGGLVWVKSRSNAVTHNLQDTARGANIIISSNSTAAQYDGGPAGVNWAFNSNGFSQNNAFTDFNASGVTYASWTFRKAPKFFDVVTYTGDGASSRSIAHNLGVAPGCVIVKASSTVSSWIVYHRGLGLNGALPNYLFLDRVDQQDTGNSAIWPSAPTSTTFSVGSAMNSNGQTYVAYLFAHDTTSDGIIQCGSYTGNGSSTGPTVNLGWEPQWLLVKGASGPAQWYLIDNMRGMALTGNGNSLYPNTSQYENQYWAANFININSTGFQVVNTDSEINASGSTYIYIAIRRGPMRTPTSGTSVFAPVTRAGTNATSTITSGSFTPDFLLSQRRNVAQAVYGVVDRLRGRVYLNTPTTEAEQSGSSSTQDLISFNMNGYTLGTNWAAELNVSGTNYVDWVFRRAPSFMDVVCYTGTGGGTTQTLRHNLGVAPELMIVKKRNDIGGWFVYSANLGNQYHLSLSSTNAANNSGNLVWNSTTPTATTFTVGDFGGVNGSGDSFVNYLFASAPGVSKVGSYTGNGSSQTINCGFAAGARFVMIKRTDSTGDWYVWDSARGIVAGNDPRLSLNSTAAEVTTDDSVDTDSSGFVVNQLSATNINVSSATYIYLAVA